MRRDGRCIFLDCDGATIETEPNQETRRKLEMRQFGLMFLVASLSACAGPTTVMQHPETLQVVTCEASAASALLGGPIGAHMSHDSCVGQLENLGFVGPEREQLESNHRPFLVYPYPPA
jgi:hypothetical protein